MKTLIRYLGKEAEAWQTKGDKFPEDTRDSDGEEYSEADGDEHPRALHTRPGHTPLETAIRNGIALNDRKTISGYAALNSRGT